MNKIMSILLSVAIVWVSNLSLHAEGFKVRISGRPSATITTGKLSLSDLAEIEAIASDSDDAAIALRKIVVRQGVAPGATVTVSADEVLQLLRQSGVNLKEVGYSLPRVMSAQRVGRQPQQHEVLAALQQMLASQGRSSAELRDLTFDDGALMPIDPVEVRAMPLRGTNPGHLSAEVTARDSDGVMNRFQVRAKVDEWLDVPVAARPLGRGTVVSEEDLQMARLNAAVLPADAISSMQSIVGLQASKDIPFGEVIRKSKVVIPPIVTVGSKVTMMYRSGRLELSATGTALESAPPGGEVKVRSEMSKRIISGVAQDDGTVLVSR